LKPVEWPDGILLLDKPAGLSSNAALQKVRRLLGAEKAGHVGSLDPLATGMLPICLNEATKVAGDILSGRKCYLFTIALGTRTATGDTEGEVVETLAVPAITEGQIEHALQAFLGQQRQVPPMYSAIKKGGQPLYKLARQGVEVEREARDIEIFELQRVREAGAPDAMPGDVMPRDAMPRDANMRLVALELRTVCSKGTYVRTLAEDIARALGTCGHVSSLRRLYVEPFEGEEMETLESIERAVAGGRRPRILAADIPLGHLAAVKLDEEGTRRLLHGQTVQGSPEGSPEPNTAEAGARLRIYGPGGRFLGLGEWDGAGAVRPRRLFTMR
jgi:tRNA pseudouridine55 synthase